MKRRLCYVISDIDTSPLMEANLRFLDPEKYDLLVIFLGARIPGLFDTLKADGFAVDFISFRGKIDIPTSLWKLSRMLRSFRPDIVHTHFFYASLVGLTAAKLIGIKNRINTRHHSVEAHLYHPHAVYYDKYVNRIATHIVAITSAVSTILKDLENVPAEKIWVVRHGFDLDRFDRALSQPTCLKGKYGLDVSFPVVGVISRFIHWKGIQYIIPAFKELLKGYPNAKLVLANANGSYEPEVRKLLADLSPDRYCVIPFEREIIELYKSFDIFVHVPIGEEYEAFGLVYIEPLAMKVPSIFTMSGIAKDFIKDGIDALVVPFKDPEAIAEGLLSLSGDSALRDMLAENGSHSIRSEFKVERMIDELDNLYLHQCR